jgi:hypothetical protein
MTVWNVFINCLDPPRFSSQFFPQRCRVHPTWLVLRGVPWVLLSRLVRRNQLTGQNGTISPSRNKCDANVRKVRYSSQVSVSCTPSTTPSRLRGTSWYTPCTCRDWRYGTSPATNCKTWGTDSLRTSRYKRVSGNLRCVCSEGGKSDLITLRTNSPIPSRNSYRKKMSVLTSSRKETVEI